MAFDFERSKRVMTFASLPEVFESVLMLALDHLACKLPSPHSPSVSSDRHSPSVSSDKGSRIARQLIDRHQSDRQLLAPRWIAQHRGSIKSIISIASTPSTANRQSSENGLNGQAMAKHCGADSQKHSHAFPRPPL